MRGFIFRAKLDNEAELEWRIPNFYWHDFSRLEKSDIHESRLCWIIRFEQARRPDHYFEVWLDFYTGEVLGGKHCR
ncbi:MAG: hypothetical protein RMJ15_06775 [Nitrososphaerota archaeon]|nr:hypothetical protein [Candidatus Bathyarchaeota archaeon]MDW8023422.1 hypothetical protein [Nitrososphaerota archaeon]